MERELKVLVTEEIFYKILNVFDGQLASPFVQDNTYYDTDDRRLHQLDASLRLRNFESSSEWTIKQQKNELESLEINQINSGPIKPVPLQLSVEHIQKLEILGFLSDHDIHPEELHATTHLRTKRWTADVDDGQYAFDKSFYQGVTDYEIELETDNLEEALAQFQTLLDRFAVEYETAPTKLARAMKTPDQA